LAAALAVLGASFWLSLAFDWLFEPPRALRIAALVAIAAALGYVVYRLLIARISVRLHNRNLAVLLERRFGQFHDALITAVEMADAPAHARSCNADSLPRTHRHALARAEQIDLGEVFNAGPLARRISLALALAVVAIV